LWTPVKRCKFLLIGNSENQYTILYNERRLMILCAASYTCSSAEMLTLYFCSSQNTSARVNIITVIEISLHLFYTFCRWLHHFKRCNFTPLKVLFLWQKFYTFLGVNLHPWKRCSFTPLKVLLLWQAFYTFLGVKLHLFFWECMWTHFDGLRTKLLLKIFHRCTHVFSEQPSPIKLASNAREVTKTNLVHNLSSISSNSRP